MPCGGRPHFLSVEAVIFSAVVELLFDSFAYFDTQLGSDGHVASVKQGV